MQHVATTTNSNEAMRISQNLMGQGYKVLFQRNGNAINIFVDQPQQPVKSIHKTQKKSKKAHPQGSQSIPWWVYAGIVLYILYAIFT